MQAPKDQKENLTMTVGALKQVLEIWPDDYEITFSGDLEFYRLKQRGEGLVNMEFNQTVYKRKDGTWQVEG